VRPSVILLKSGNSCEKRSESAVAARLIQVVSMSIIAISFIFGPDSLPKIDLCFFHAVTGLQCPGCGMTRAFCAISYGQFARAWSLNPLSFHLYTLTVLGLAYPFFVNVVREKFIGIVVLVTAAAFAVFGICRIFYG